MEHDERTIREFHSTWIAAVNAGDLDRLLGLIADDLVLLSPGQEPSGREGFIAGFSNAHRQLHLRCISELEEVVVVGDLAFARSRDSLSVTPRASPDNATAETTQLAGDRLTIYRKHPDGRWLLARDAHTLTPR